MCVYTLIYKGFNYSGLKWIRCQRTAYLKWHNYIETSSTPFYIFFLFTECTQTNTSHYYNVEVRGCYASLVDNSNAPMETTLVNVCSHYNILS